MAIDPVLLEQLNWWRSFSLLVYFYKSLGERYTSDFGQIPVKVTCNLFDTLVKPILTYNLDISFMDSYLKFLELHYVQKNVILKLMN
jgi:hypothetical protein